MDERVASSDVESGNDAASAYARSEADVDPYASDARSANSSTADSDHSHGDDDGEGGEEEQRGSASSTGSAPSRRRARSSGRRDYTNRHWKAAQPSVETIQLYEQELHRHTARTYRRLLPQSKYAGWQGVAWADDAGPASESDDGEAGISSAEEQEGRDSVELEARSQGASSNWTELELDLLFLALARHSRLRPDLISEEINRGVASLELPSSSSQDAQQAPPVVVPQGKSELQVQLYLARLQRGARGAPPMPRAGRRAVPDEADELVNSDAEESRAGCEVHSKLLCHASVVQVPSAFVDWEERVAQALRRAEEADAARAVLSQHTGAGESANDDESEEEEESMVPWDDIVDNVCTFVYHALKQPTHLGAKEQEVLLFPPDLNHQSPVNVQGYSVKMLELFRLFVDPKTQEPTPAWQEYRQTHSLVQLLPLATESDVRAFFGYLMHAGQLLLVRDMAAADSKAAAPASQSASTDGPAPPLRRMRVMLAKRARRQAEDVILNNEEISSRTQRPFVFFPSPHHAASLAALQALAAKATSTASPSSATESRAEAPDLPPDVVLARLLSTSVQRLKAAAQRAEAARAASYGALLTWADFSVLQNGKASAEQLSRLSAALDGPGAVRCGGSIARRWTVPKRLYVNPERFEEYIAPARWSVETKKAIRELAALVDFEVLESCLGDGARRSQFLPETLVWCKALLDEFVRGMLREVVADPAVGKDGITRHVSLAHADFRNEARPDILHLRRQSSRPQETSPLGCLWIPRSHPTCRSARYDQRMTQMMRWTTTSRAISPTHHARRLRATCSQREHISRRVEPRRSICARRRSTASRSSRPSLLTVCRRTQHPKEKTSSRGGRGATSARSLGATIRTIRGTPSACEATGKRQQKR